METINASDFQRNIFSVLKAVKEGGQVSILHRDLGRFTITPEVNNSKAMPGALAGRIHVRRGAFEGWSEEVEEDFGV